MRFHTLALMATLGYIAKKPLVLARYRFRVVMEFRKTSPSRSTGLERGSYYINFDMQTNNPANWKIEQVEADRPIYKERNYPELKKFEYAQDGSAKVQVDHSQAKEYLLDLKSDNRRDIDIEYKCAYGYGNTHGQFSSEFDQVTMRDYGPTPHQDYAVIDADIRFDQVMKL